MLCVFRFCCDDGAHSNRQRISNNNTAFIQQGLPLSSDQILSRGEPSPLRRDNTTRYQVASQGFQDEDSDNPYSDGEQKGEDNGNGDNDDCFRGGSSSLSLESVSSDRDSLGTRRAHGVIRSFYEQVRDQWRRYGSLERTDMIDSVNKDCKDLEREKGKNKEQCLRIPMHRSPLMTASKFGMAEGGEIPSIQAEQVVLPGSKLQKEMARAICLTLEKQEDECVICMERFDETNPRMPTLCGCGENKTYFHLPCLYQWIEHSRECPTCRQTLRWEEF